MIVLIPAYEPDESLPDLVSELVAGRGFEVVVIDDGSGAEYQTVFSAAAASGATLLAHPYNRGKGAALKTALGWIEHNRAGQDVITADADGQHRPDDIARIAECLRASDLTPELILGARAFTGDVPLRSRVGNSMARGAFTLAAGWRLSDTQTGLRGIPASLIPWARNQRGERFEFEQNVLLRSRRDGVTVREVPIATVYLRHNASSHFRPIVDSIRVMAPVLRFAGSSFIGFLIDTALLLALTAATGLIIPSIVIARLASASVNFALNRRFVFDNPGRLRDRRALARSAVRYAVLAAALLASNIVWLTALTSFGMPLLAAKVLTEIVLFVTSYGAQKAFVFSRSEVVSRSEAPHSRRIAAPTEVEHAPALTRRLP